MNYPTGTIVQNYNVAAGRLIQLPCFGDQDEPPEGFRAMVLGSFAFGNNYPNQSGPNFVPNQAAAVQFDLTTVLNNFQMSKIRSMAVMLQCAGMNSGIQAYALLNSGWQVPIGNRNISYYDGTQNEAISTDSLAVFDFLSAEPIFGIYMPFTPNSDPYAGPFGTLVVANFKLSAGVFLPGSSF